MVLLSMTLYGSVNAQSIDKEMKNAACAYFMCLNHSNSGVIESAIVNIMKLKFFNPDIDYTKCIYKLEQLSKSGQTKFIRVKAYVAANYLKHPERFNWFKSGLYQEISTFFDEYSEKISASVREDSKPLASQQEN